MGKIKVGDVLKTTIRNWMVEVRNYESTANEAIGLVKNELNTFFILFNTETGEVAWRDWRVILPPDPIEFDWASVHPMTCINAFIMNDRRLWFHCADKGVRPSGNRWIGNRMIILCDQSKLPAALRNYSGPWQESAIVRPE